MKEWAIVKGATYYTHSSLIRGLCTDYRRVSAAICRTPVGAITKRPGVRLRSDIFVLFGSLIANGIVR